MSYELKESGELTRTATFSIPADEYESRFNDALRELSDEVDLSGFRKGKVPFKMLRSKYGDRVRPDVIEGIIRENIQDVAGEFADRLIHVGQAEVTEIPKESDDGSLEFQVDFELKPELDPVGYLGLEVEKPEPEISDEEVDERLDQLREQHARFEPIEFRETVKEGDQVTFDFKPTEEREELSDFTGEDVQAEVGSGQVLPPIEEALMGAEFNTTLNVDIDADENFPVEELRGETIELDLTIKAVKQKILPELDDDFAKDTGEAETLLDLRSQIRENLRESKQHRAEHIAEENLIEKLVDENEVALPPKFVAEQVDQEIERRMQMFQQQGIDPEQLGAETDEFRESTKEEVERNLRTEFLLLAIAEKEGFEVTEEDIDAFFEHQAQHDQRFSADQLKQFMQQNEEQWRQVQFQTLMNKTRTYLLEEAELESVEWPEEDEHAHGHGHAH